MIGSTMAGPVTFLPGRLWNATVKDVAVQLPLSVYLFPDDDVLALIQYLVARPEHSVAADLDGRLPALLSSTISSSTLLMPISNRACQKPLMAGLPVTKSLFGGNNCASSV